VGDVGVHDGYELENSSPAIGVWIDLANLKRFGDVNVADHEQSIAIVVEVPDEVSPVWSGTSLERLGFSNPK
jgi:hypothetical protein